MGEQELTQAQDLGVFSLLFLVQALAQHHGEAQPIRLTVVSTLAQHVPPEEESAFQYGSLLGLIRTVPKEMPWLDCRHLDLPEDDAAASAARIVEELGSLGRDAEVAYRQGERWVPRLQRVDFSKAEGHGLPFRRGGMYLVSGGLGGIGAQIARYLLKEYEAKLLLVGRSPLASANAAAGSPGPSDAPERVRIYRELEGLAGAVAYEPVDVGDLPALRRAVEAAERRWGCELDGVIHLAGTYHERPLAEETRESFAAALRPKVLGALTLAQLLRDGSDKLFIAFSSANSSLGGALVGAYAAANSFLEGFAYHRRRQSPRSYCLEWSMWDELGMSRGFRLKELTRARGYFVIPASQGLLSLQSALRCGHAHVVIGLDGRSEHVRQHADEGTHAVRRLCAYVAPKGAAAPWDRLRELALEDPFGLGIACEFREVAQLPLTEAGDIDRDKLGRLHRQRNGGSIDPIGPRNEVERKIAAIWREVLPMPSLGVHDDFFELGGNSILATQIASRIQDAYRLRLPLRTVLEESTVEKLAAAVERQLGPDQRQGLEAPDRIETGDARSLLARIDQLSDEEVSKLLNETLAHGGPR
jgi:NADP-dependent 3-hydroxy acid dehydrogenase YdfG/acyl carrier protein